MKLDEIITEAVFNTDPLVDFIYNDVFKDYIDIIQRYVAGEQIAPISIKEKMYTSADILKMTDDETIRTAVVMNPIVIEAGALLGGSWYDPKNEIIHVSFNFDVHELILGILRAQVPYKKLLEKLDPAARKNFENELNGFTVKASIAHEISHWLSDTLHNNHLKRMLQKVYDARQKQKDPLPILHRNEVDIYMTDYEIDAQVHAIRQLRREHTKEAWDLLTLDDLLDVSPPLRTVANRIHMTYTRQDLSRFFKLILRRLHRENLLGKNMYKISRY